MFESNPRISKRNQLHAKYKYFILSSLKIGIWNRKRFHLDWIYPYDYVKPIIQFSKRKVIIKYGKSKSLEISSLNNSHIKSNHRLPATGDVPSPTLSLSHFHNLASHPLKYANEGNTRQQTFFAVNL